MIRPRDVAFGAVALALLAIYSYVASLTGPLLAQPAPSAAPRAATQPPERTDAPRLGGSIAFVLRGDLYLLRGGRYAPVTAEARNEDPALTQDGATLYFVRREGIDGKRVADGALVNARLGYTRIMSKPAGGGKEDVEVDGLRQRSPTGQHLVSWVFDPAPSPDGKRLAFVEDDGDGAMDLVVLTFSSGSARSTRTLLSQGAELADPAWSPDGKSIAVTSYNAKQAGILIWSADKPGAAQRLTGLPEGEAYRPSYSSDGKWIVYTLRRDGRSDVHAFELATKRDVALTSDGRSWNGVFAPDMSQVAFLREAEGTIDLYAMPLGDALAGGTAKEAIKLTRGEGVDGTSRPSWSR